MSGIPYLILPILTFKSLGDGYMFGIEFFFLNYIIQIKSYSYENRQELQEFTTNDRFLWPEIEDF